MKFSVATISASLFALAIAGPIMDLQKRTSPTLTVTAQNGESETVNYDTDDIHNPGTCTPWELTNEAVVDVIPENGACVILFEGPNCSGTASGAIGQNNPQEPVDSFWATHTNTLLLYRTVDGSC